MSDDCNWIYKQLGSDDDDREEDEIPLPFRTTLQSVARTLNQIDWSQHMPVAHGFIVIATDYIGYWFPEDVSESIGAERLADLQKSGRMPSWDMDDDA